MKITQKTKSFSLRQLRKDILKYAVETGTLPDTLDMSYTTYIKFADCVDGGYGDDRMPYAFEGIPIYLVDGTKSLSLKTIFGRSRGIVMDD